MLPNEFLIKSLYSSSKNVLIVSVTISLIILLNFVEAKNNNQANNLERKSIVFDLKTPKVYYCPQEKPADLEKLIVMAQPLDKLCEFGGKPKPKGFKSDCYNDVDETDFACDEKRRFMIKLDIASELHDTTTEGIDDLEYILTKNSGKKKAMLSGKKY